MNEFENEINPVTADPAPAPVIPDPAPVPDPIPAPPVQDPAPMPDPNAIRFAPELSPRPPKQQNRGLRLFLCVTAAVMVLCLVLTGGYLAGRYAGLDRRPAPPAAVVSKPTDGKTMTASEISDAMQKSVVAITVYSAAGEAAEASGVVLNADGYILTNDHIYAEVPGARFLITAADGTAYDARFIAGDARSDIAVLKIDGDLALTPAVFGDSEQVVVGESALLVGYSMGAAAGPMLTEGTVTSRSARVNASATTYSARYIVSDAALNPGAAGGALVNAYGQVIGIPCNKVTGDYNESINLSIPSNTALSVAESLIENGYVTGRARLGVSYTENSELLHRIDSSIKVGLVVQQISDDSPLALTDVAVGDVITAVNGTPITSGEVLLDVIADAQPGDTLTLQIYHTESGTSADYRATLLEDRGSSSYSINGSGNDQTEIG